MAALDAIAEVLRQYWGYDRFLPLQAEAMTSVLDGRDSVVVLPTGGGKSLCFQAPALCLPGLALVVSPLISLMKDQVDALRNCGVPAALVNSTLSAAERRRVADDVRAERVRLLYLAPERLLTEGTLEFLKQARVSLVAIDEAHCISSWGHDFRPEYRGLRVLKEAFPNVGIHAYTATATEQVRQDIAEQLRLTSPEVLVGAFDRPNLIYKVERRQDRLKQLRDVLDRHRGESGIIYCITRKDVEQTAGALEALGYRVRPYHAGLPDDDRRRNQEAFIEDETDTIVATVAFGMGIDKSNVRYVIHAGMPKSLEHYQQESGRAGRDGLEAECCLFYSGQDYGVWKRMIDESESASREGGLRALGAMLNFCGGIQCRHRAISEYFGQQLQVESCNACDVCLGQLDLVDGPLIVGQKILSCVMRLQQRFGADYTAKVLLGSEEARILQFRHNQLSTWGLLRDEQLRTVRDWIEQLVSQDFLVKVGEYNVLQVTPTGWRLLRGEVAPRLLRPAKATKAQKAGPAAESWEGVDRGLFDELRRLRQERAAAQNVPAYVIFHDTSLREMARRRPSTLGGFGSVPGVGEKKLADYGPAFVERIAAYCAGNELPMDVVPPTPSGTDCQSVLPGAAREPGPSIPAVRAFPLFRQGLSLDEVGRQLNRAPSTVRKYLTDFLRHEGCTDPSPWVDAEIIRRITGAAEQVGTDRMRPIFDVLGTQAGHEQVGYDLIAIVIECLRNRQKLSG